MEYYKKYVFILFFCIFALQTFPVKADVKEIKYQPEVNYPPYKYMNNNQISGFDIELTNLIFKNEDYRLSISTDSWDKIYERLRAGEIDTTGLMVVNNERKKDILFSNTVLDTYISIYTRNGFDRVTLEDLSKYSVGVGKEQYSEDILRDNLKLTNYKQYDNISQAVDALAKGQIDVLFENQEVVNYYITTKDLKNTIVQQVDDLFPQHVCYGVNKANPELVDYINKRLDDLHRSGAYEELYQKYFFYHSKIYKQNQKEKYVALGIIIIIILIILHIVSQRYIRALRKKVITERTQYEDMLKEKYEELKMYQEQLHYNAYYDSLTGLPNRLYLYENTSSLINTTISAGDKGALLFIDVDNFKLINDTFGHNAGDILLQNIAARLIKICPKKSNLIRLGGDEFIIVLTNIDSENSVETIGKNLIDIFNDPFSINEIVVNSTLSIGICMFPKDGDNLGVLLKNADTAMYKSKSLGRNTFIFYNETMSKDLMDRINLEDNLKSALKNNEFKLYYQPQLDLTSGKITGMEALIRWDNPKLGRVPPDKFISVAEEMGLIIPIGEWVIKTACEFLVKLHNEGFKNLKISVNISIVQLIQNNFPDIVMRILSETGLSPNYLELEITETVLMENIDTNIEKLRMLRNLGLDIALDDFGKGYSSLNYLKSLPINTLKIDKSFIDDVVTNNLTESIVSSIILIGHKIGHSIVAEGIEDRTQLAYLKAAGCNIMQGYLLSKPLPEEEVISFLNTRK
ncbi:diguanylate cyclase domain protein [Clostridiales bacterium oral taxon 876 str. F0540]|nr:diguanylate cyclase domain protein [Clostridiales bacterium oral taxon 876 str. F0540]